VSDALASLIDREHQKRVWFTAESADWVGSDRSVDYAPTASSGVDLNELELWQLEGSEFLVLSAITLGP
jgi:hypothetical protein